jgi:hypothetical protein
VGLFASQAKNVQQLIIDCLDELPQTGQPSAPGFGPVLFAALMGRSDQIDLGEFLEIPSRPIPANPFSATYES